MIEKRFDVPFVAGMALREKQIQQSYRPVIAVHKWFARRPGTLFRSLLLSEFAEGALRDHYFRANDLSDKRVADPFMGGGTPLLEANRLGCAVIGYDINPMAYWVVRQEIEHIDLEAYRRAAAELSDWLEDRIGHLYRTRCLQCGSRGVPVKYFLWVKTQACKKCGRSTDLFPSYLVAENQRHPKNVFVCGACGELNESEDRINPGCCRSCGAAIDKAKGAKNKRWTCSHCQTTNSYPTIGAGPPKHRMFAIEYYCPTCKSSHSGRFFKKPDEDDLAKYRGAEATWEQTEPIFVPDDGIPAGDETDRLHRWGYHRYRDMFNERQLLALELSCRAIAEQSDERLRNALATNLSDLLRYQNMLCRYDTAALKSLDIFSVHGFPVGLIQCESNFLGIPGRVAGTSVGSGGWLNIVEKYAKGKVYCEHPFEVRQRGRGKVWVPISGEWIGDRRNGVGEKMRREVVLQCASATAADLAPNSLDAVLTDPPYFGNVQYAELMDFCYVWLRRLVGKSSEVFQAITTRNPNELTGNTTMDRGLSHFTEGLSEAFRRMARALKPGSPLVFTYHHNTLEAYYPVAVSILDSGLACTASLPCPAEMGASIHINGTGSSIIDTIFVCRSTGRIPRRWLVDTAEEIAALVLADIHQLEAGGVRSTRGDIRCIIYGHLTRLVVWELRRSWDMNQPVEARLAAVARQLTRFGGFLGVEACLGPALSSAAPIHGLLVRDHEERYEVGGDEVSF